MLSTSSSLALRCRTTWTAFYRSGDCHNNASLVNAGSAHIGNDTQITGFSSRTDRKVLAYVPVMANKGGGPQAVRALLF